MDGATFETHFVKSVRGLIDATCEATADDRPILTAGRGPDRAECFATIASHRPSGPTSLFSTAPLFERLNGGVTRITGVELDLVAPVTLTGEGLRSFADLMLADRAQYLESTAVAEMKR